MVVVGLPDEEGTEHERGTTWWSCGCEYPPEHWLGAFALLESAAIVWLCEMSANAEDRPCIMADSCPLAIGRCA